MAKVKAITAISRQIKEDQHSITEEVLEELNDGTRQETMPDQPQEDSTIIMATATIITATRVCREKDPEQPLIFKPEAGPLGGPGDPDNPDNPRGDGLPRDTLNDHRMQVLLAALRLTLAL